MKIGILTYHRAINYGAILQSYALQAFLEQHGFDASFVDYWPDYHKAFYKIFNFCLIFKLRTCLFQINHY